MSDYRLDRAFVPSTYSIDLDASPSRSTFSGVVRISGVLQRGWKRIELNGRAITVKKAVMNLPKQKVKLKAKLHKARETIELIPAKLPASAGKAMLEIHYTGKLDPSMHGLYLAKEGKEKSLVSQCEATDARAIFPCMDEPEFKIHSIVKMVVVDCAKSMWMVKNN